jgi:hypothetical protein
MLKITQQPGVTGRRTFQLEGRLVGPWVAELRHVLDGFDTGSLRIDLAALGFADRDGVTLLRTLRDGGAELAEASGFLAALIGVEHGEDVGEDPDVG